MEKAIRDAPDAFHAALLRGDAEFLATVLTDVCRIIGPKGFFIDKSEWIGTHEDSEYTQVRLESREVEVREYGDTAIRWEVQDSRCVYKGQTIDGLFRVTQVWVRLAEAWRLASLQYTSLPPR
jgi:ketosteroid isomerase-like protein